MADSSSKRKSVGERSTLVDRTNKLDETVASTSRAVAKLDDERLTQTKRRIRDTEAGLKSGTLFDVQSTLHANLTRRSTKSRRFSSPSRAGRRRDGTDSSSAMTIDALEPDWDTIKRWPDRLIEEEKALGDYFRRLKMIQLEQETRNIFVHDTNDDTQTVYTLSEVRQLEAEVHELKDQLKARKQKARQLRKQIDEAAQGLLLFDQLQSDVNECTRMIVEIEDLELELARLDAVHGIKACLSVGGDHENDDTDDDDKARTRAPAVGTFTRDEADQILNNQLASMEQLDGEQTVMLRQIEAAKKQLAQESQTLDRLNAERATAEKLARQAVLDTDRQRDHKLEAVCRGYTATVQILQNVVGIRAIDAPNDRSIRVVYTVSDPRARRYCQEVAIDLHFATASGDRLSGYELCTTSGRLLTDGYAPPGTQARRRMDMAVYANDASLLLQEALLCIESIECE